MNSFILPEYDGELYQDLEIGFNLPLNMLLEVDDTKPAQNILGDSTTIPLEFDFGVAGTELTNQVIDGTWAVAKQIPGIRSAFQCKRSSLAKKDKKNDKCEDKNCHCISCYCGGGDGGE